MTHPTATCFALHLALVALVTAACTACAHLAGLTPAAGLCGGVLVHGALLVAGRD